MKSMMKLQVTKQRSALANYELQVRRKAKLRLRSVSKSRRQKASLCAPLWLKNPFIHSLSIINYQLLIIKYRLRFCVLAVLFCFLTVFVGAQNYVTFEYDASGNNVSRTIYMSNQAPPAPPVPPTPPQSPYSNTFADNNNGNNDNNTNQNPPNYDGENITETFNEKLPQNIDNVEEMPEQTYTDFIAETVINIYPNPTKGKLAVKISTLPENSVSSLTLLNIQGTVITQQQPLTDYNELDISAQPDGMYIMQITIDAKSTTWRIIKN